MTLDFPDSPTDGEKYVDLGTGESWSYEAATNSWTSDGLTTSNGIQYQGSLDFTQPPPTGVKADWLYGSSTTGTPNVGFTGLSGTVNKGDVVMFTGTDWMLASRMVPDATAAIKGIDTQKWTRTGTELSPATAGDLVNPVSLPMATAAIQGVVKLADADAVTAGTAGRVVDAAQLKAVSDADDWTRTGTEISPKVAGDSVFTSGAVKVGGTTTAPNLQIKADGGIFAANTFSIGTAGSERLRIDSSAQLKANFLGSAALPVWSFVSDPNTGIYSPGSDQVAISTNGVGRVTVDSTAAPLKEVFASVFYPVVTQADIGTGPNQVPINGYLGALAFQNQVSFLRSASTAPEKNLDINFEYVSDTSIKIRMRGSDGTVRSTTLTLA